MAHNLCISFLLALLLVNSITNVEASSYDHGSYGHGSYGHDYDYDYDYGHSGGLRWLSPWDVQDLPREPRVNFYRDLRSCLNTLTQRCNNRLYNYVMYGQEIHRPCCRKLYAMEVGCLESLAWVLDQGNYEYKARHVDERFKDVLTMCGGFGK